MAQALADRIKLKNSNMIINHCAPCLIRDMGTFNDDLCQARNNLSNQSEDNPERFPYDLEATLRGSDLQGTQPTCQQLVCKLFPDYEEC